MTNRILNYFGRGPKINPPKTVNQVLQENWEKEKAQFIADASLPYVNENIPSIFYEGPASIRRWEEEHEHTWSHRVLLQSTFLGGNVLMTYDAFKRGFVYYSDVSYLPGLLLNTLALKYVRKFRCRDFYMDEIENPDSPLIALQKQYLKPESLGDHSYLQNNPHLLRKSKPASLPSRHVAKRTGPTQADETIRNKFIYLGKMSNFSWIQPTLKNILLRAPKLSKVTYAEFQKMAREVAEEKNKQNNTQSIHDDNELLFNPEDEGASVQLSTPPKKPLKPIRRESAFVGVNGFANYNL